MGGLIDHVSHPSDFLVDHINDIIDRQGRDKDLSIDFLKSLNDDIWGLHKKKMYVVAGRPSMGKSTLMLQMANHLAKQGKKIFYFTFEMTKEECLDRFITNECSIDNYFLYTGKLGDAGVYPRYIDRISKLNDNLKTYNLAIIESFGKQFGELLEAITTLKDPDCVFIDYVNMVKGVGLRKDVVDEYIKDLRALSIKNNFCAVVGAQIGRSAHGDKNDKVSVPNLWNLKETGTLEEVADAVIIVHWNWFYTRDGEKQDYIIRVAKNRCGKTGEYNCKFEPEYYRITQGDKNETAVTTTRKDVV
jgi:replicative DNA helicase